MLFAKKMKKICQIWPWETLKHFTAAYRGFPPCTQSQQRDRVQQCTKGEEAGGDEEEPPVGVLADDLEKEVDKPEDPHPAEDDGGAKDGVRVGTDVHRLGLHRQLRAHNLSLRWLNWE